MARAVSLAAGHREVCLSAQVLGAPRPLACSAAYLELVQAHTVLEATGITTATEDSAEAVQTATRVVQAPEEGPVTAAGCRQQVPLPSEAHLEVAQEVRQMATTKPELLVQDQQILAHLVEAPV